VTVELHDRSARTLRGRVVLVTRPPDQAAELVGMLEARGASALVAPAIEVRPAPARALLRAARDLADGTYEWAILTSRAGVDALFARMDSAGLDGRDIRARVAAVGEGTAGALRARGVDPDLVPSTFTTSALGRAMPRGAGRVLLARADIAPGDLEAAVAAKGWTPVRVDAYRTRAASKMPAEVARALAGGRVDAVTFTSASTVQGFMRLAPSGLGRRPKVVCIGPVTARAARDAGLSVDALARPHTIEGLVAAVERVLSGHQRKERR
jgi:uroporphyrinogen-III synthase